jgi:Ser/Thr protein kinase RdoA (MazF antagonist)
MQVGFVGTHYQAYDLQRRQYFITVYDGSMLARISAGRLSFTLPVIHHLQQSGQFLDLAASLPTKSGKLLACLGSMPVILYPYLDGHLLAEEDTGVDEIQRELGRLVARLHRADIDPNIENPIQEKFRFHFEEPLQQGLEALEKIRGHEVWGKTALRNLLLPQIGKITGLLNRLHELADQMRQISPPFVICHTDIHPWNVFRTTDSRLVIVDWDGVCLAPAEHDLFIFTGSGFKAFLKAYYAAGGQRNLTASGFAFYFYRRNLEDLTDFMMRILEEEGGQERNRKDLEGIQQDCMAGWADLDTAEERMQVELKELENIG